MNGRCYLIQNKFGGFLLGATLRPTWGDLAAFAFPFTREEALEIVAIVRGSRMLEVESFMPPTGRRLPDFLVGYAA